MDQNMDHLSRTSENVNCSSLKEVGTTFKLIFSSPVYTYTGLGRNLSNSANSVIKVRFNNWNYGWQLKWWLSIRIASSDCDQLWGSWEPLETFSNISQQLFNLLNVDFWHIFKILSFTAVEGSKTRKELQMLTLVMFKVLWSCNVVLPDMGGYLSIPPLDTVSPYSPYSIFNHIPIASFTEPLCSYSFKHNGV